MIKGVKFWSESTRRHEQTNNASEEILRKAKIGLESCGATACASILDSMGLLPPMFCGQYEQQAEDIIMNCLNDPINYSALAKIRQDISPVVWYGNRIPQYYPWVAKYLFNADVQFFMQVTWNRLKDFLSNGQGVQLCLTNPGHYIGAVAYDDEQDTIIYNDPWGARSGNQNNGFNEKLTKLDWELKVNKWVIVYKN